MRDRRRTSFMTLSFAVVFVLILLAAAVYAQSGVSTVRGTVKDPQGNVVAGANVNLTNPDKNFSRTQTTNQDGTYIFTAIPPGTYQLNVEATGFTTASASGLGAFVAIQM